MEETTNTATVDTGATNKGEPNKAENTPETITLEEHKKAIQSAEDKVRTEKSKQIKALEEKIKELTPVEKKPEEVEFETRLAALEKAQAEVDQKNKYLDIQATLQKNNIDKSYADYIKTDADVEAFISLYAKSVSEIKTANGYKPSGHQTTMPTNKKEFDAMSFEQQNELFASNPQLAKTLMGMK